MRLSLLVQPTRVAPGAVLLRDPPEPRESAHELARILFLIRSRALDAGGRDVAALFDGHGERVGELDGGAVRRPIFGSGEDEIPNPSAREAAVGPRGSDQDLLVAPRAQAFTDRVEDAGRQRLRLEVL